MDEGKTFIIAIESKLDQSRGKFDGKFPLVKNKDGSQSNVLLTTIDDGKGTYKVLPSMMDGKKMSDKEFRAYAKKNWDTLPTFGSSEEADAWANKYHSKIREDGSWGEWAKYN